MAYEPTKNLSKRLKSRVTIKRSVDVPDGHGGFNTTWEPVDTVWAEVISQSGREAVIANALQGVSSYRITIRWRDDVTPANQIELRGGKVLNIRAADDPDEGRVALVIFADTEAVQQ